MWLTVTDATHHSFLAASYAWLADKTAAEAHVERIRTLDAQFTLAAFLATTHYGNERDLTHLRDGLEKAGITA